MKKPTKNRVKQLKSRKMPTLYVGSHPTDFVKLLGQLGFSYKCIARETGFSIGSIGRTLCVNGISVKAYRNGDTPLAEMVIRRGAGLPLNQPPKKLVLE